MHRGYAQWSGAWRCPDGPHPQSFAFDLDEHHRPPINGHQIQFAQSLVKMPGHDVVALPFEKASRDRFAALAK
jgi:hypothetical protein